MSQPNLSAMLEQPYQDKLPPKNFGLFASSRCTFYNGENGGGWKSLCRFSDDADELISLGKNDNNDHMYSWQVVDMRSGLILQEYVVKD